jgi:Family of unknown function (DUF5691)
LESSSATPARKAQFLSQLRQRDPGQALTLIAQQLPHEKAEVRLRLLAVLAIQLSAADQSVLESAALDRAPKVKALAQQLLSSFPDSLAPSKSLAVMLGKEGRHRAICALRERHMAVSRYHSSPASLCAEFEVVPHSHAHEAHQSCYSHPSE